MQAVLPPLILYYTEFLLLTPSHQEKRKIFQRRNLETLLYRKFLAPRESLKRDVIPEATVFNLKTSEQDKGCLPLSSSRAQKVHWNPRVKTTQRISIVKHKAVVGVWRMDWTVAVPVGVIKVEGEGDRSWGVLLKALALRIGVQVPRVDLWVSNKNIPQKSGHKDWPRMRDQFR